MSEPTFTPTIHIPRGDEDPRDGELPPALLDAIHDDPTMIQPMARVYLATVMHESFKESSGYTPAQKLAFAEFCNRVGISEPRKSQEVVATGPTFSVSISIPGLPTAGITVQGVATPVSDEDTPVSIVDSPTEIGAEPISVEEDFCGD